MPDTGYCISILLYLSLAYREGILKRYRGVVGKSDNGKPLADGLFDIFFRVIGTVAESRVSMEVEWQLRITNYGLRINFQRVMWRLLYKLYLHDGEEHQWELKKNPLYWFYHYCADRCEFQE